MAAKLAVSGSVRPASASTVRRETGCHAAAAISTAPRGHSVSTHEPATYVPTAD